MTILTSDLLPHTMGERGHTMEEEPRSPLAMAHNGLGHLGAGAHHQEYYDEYNGMQYLDHSTNLHLGAYPPTPLVQTGRNNSEKQSYLVNQ